MVAKIKTKTDFRGKEILESYNSIRQNFLKAETMASRGGMSFTPNLLFGGKGFYKVPDSMQLQSRTGGLDKLFYTLIQGVVEDPDFAVKKDSRIYQRMLRDPQIFYCLNVRKAATASLAWQVVPKQKYTRDERAIKLAGEVEQRLRQIPRFEELILDILDALLPGLSVVELIWTVNSDGHYVVQQHYPMNKDRFRFSKDGQLRLLSPKAPTTGLPVPLYKFITHTYGKVAGSWHRPEEIGYNYYGRGLADTPLYHYFHFKVAALKYLVQSMERTGFPSKILYTGPQNSALASRLSEIMIALKNDAVITIPGRPDDVKVDQLQTHANWQLFMRFMEYVDMLITRSILGQDLMTQVGPTGSYAQAQVHQNVFQMLRQQDRNQVANTLTQTLVSYDCILNDPKIPRAYWPQFKFKESTLSDALPFIQLVQSATQLGIEVSEAQVRELTGLREPQEGEKIITGSNNLAEETETGVNPDVDKTKQEV